MAMAPAEQAGFSNKNATSNLSVSIIDKTYIAGGRILGTHALTANAWTNIATISDVASRPPAEVHGICVDPTMKTVEAKIGTDGKVSLYANTAVALINPVFCFVDVLS